MYPCSDLCLQDYSPRLTAATSSDFLEIALVDAFNPVEVNVYKLVCFEESFHLRPNASEQSMKFAPPQIPESNMNHPWRRAIQYDPF